MNKLNMALCGALSLAFVTSTAMADVKRPAPNQHGRVTVHNCPYNCGHAGVPREFCRDWRENGMCYVEDVRLPPTPAPKPQPQRYDDRDRGHRPPPPPPSRYDDRYRDDRYRDDRYRDRYRDDRYRDDRYRDDRYRYDDYRRW